MSAARRSAQPAPRRGRRRGVDGRGRLLGLPRAAAGRRSPAAGRAAQAAPVPLAELRPVVRKNGTSAPSPAASSCRRSAGSGSGRARWRAGAPSRRRSCRRRGRRRRGCASRSVPASAARRGRGRRSSAPPTRVSSGEAVDRSAAAARQDAVGEVEALHDGRHLVLAVVAERADDEREVELRGRRRAVHAARASARATNSGGSSSSARAAARGRSPPAPPPPRPVARPASSSEFGSVLRRCAKAAATSA